jgi:hypothetical protein
MMLVVNVKEEHFLYDNERIILSIQPRRHRQSSRQLLFLVSDLFM